MIVLNSLESRGGFISVMSQFLDEAGLALFWKKMTDKLSAQTVAEKNTQLVEKDITSMYEDGSLFENIKNGHFDGINPGNYFNATVNNLEGTATDFTFVVLELDRYYGTSGNTGNSKTEHHIVVTTKGSTSFGVNVMNSSSNNGGTNSGGYVGSTMFKTTIPKVDSALQSVFSDHLKTVSLNLSNTGYKQKPYTYVNTLVKSYLFTEYEVFGTNTYDDEKYTAYPQYAAFKLNSLLESTLYAYWERSVGTNSDFFCGVSNSGSPASGGYAINYRYIRPGFLLG